jgi:hypothetical protein
LTILKIIKTNFKKITFLYHLNAAYKARRLKKRYLQVKKYYENMAIEKAIIYSENLVRKKLEDTITKKKTAFNARKGKKLRFFYVGADKEQDYGGIIQGLEKYGEVIVYKQKTGRYGQFLFSEAGKNASLLNSNRLLEVIESIYKDGWLDCLFGQLLSNRMEPFALKKVQELGVPIVNIAMDDRHIFRGNKIYGRWSGTAGLIGYVDLVCTTAQECCLWYQVEGCPSIYLPEASDPELYYPRSGKKKYDVCFIGANYGIRSKIVKTIQKRGINIICYGNDWPNGRIDTKYVPELFARSKIVLGVGTIGHCTDFYALKMRDFDGPMSGSMYITHDNPDLYELYEVGKEIITYKTPKECAEKIKYYLGNDDEREKIARAGRLRAEKEHTWEKRFQEVFNILGLKEIS